MHYTLHSLLYKPEMKLQSEITSEILSHQIAQMALRLRITNKYFIAEKYTIKHLI